jgi:Zn-dependent oligopeptidase
MMDRYTYSLVFAADMYETVFKRNPLDPVCGKLYRDKILRVGSSREELVSLTVSDNICEKIRSMQ